MKRILFITTLLFTSMFFAQQQNNYCATSPVSPHFSDMENVRGLDHSNDIFYIKIYVHVLQREFAPKFGQTIEDVNRQLKTLYDDFDPLGIYFVWNGSIDYIENNDFFEDPYEYRDSIFNTNNHADGIDIYLSDGLRSGQSVAQSIGSSAFLAGSYYTGTQGIGEQFPASWSKTISHEMGHCLFLWHTHHGTYDEGSGNECPELVNPITDPNHELYAEQVNNKSLCGDYIVDTPADPNMEWNADWITCEYVHDPNDVDANGDVYEPDSRNIMSYTYPSCRDTFTLGQKKRMKNAIWYLPLLHNTLIETYTYVRPESDCFVCFDNDTHLYTVYSTIDISHLYAISSGNVETEIVSTSGNSFTLRVTSLLGIDEGERGHFSIVNSGRGMIVATQNVWVGVPQAVPDQTVDGYTTAWANRHVVHSIDNGELRLEGIETLEWEFPEPNRSYAGLGNWEDDPDFWEYDYFSKYEPIVQSSAGSHDGYVKVHGKNPCGDGKYGLDNEICVENSDDPDTFCSAPIIYYPNPADSLLSVDLSLQDYDIFTVTVYNDNQVAVYTDQSENVVKTIATFNLSNGMYYLHIYDSTGNQIFSATLVINH